MGVVTEQLSVGALVYQTLVSGDINDRFGGNSTALEGIRGHQMLQRQREAGYQAERTVNARFSFEVKNDTARLVNTGETVAHDDAAPIPENSQAGSTIINLQIGGRVDGLYPGRSPLEVEEIKTLRGDPAQLPGSQLRQHWGQVRLYAHLLLCELEQDEVTLRLRYLDLDTETEHNFEASASRAELSDFFFETVGRFCRQKALLAQWHLLRDESLALAGFPHGRFREGQRALATSTYRAVTQKAQVVLQAPTGIGKTMGVLYPAVKALPVTDTQKVFFLTAKTIGRKVAERAVAAMGECGMRIRSVTITAKQKTCFNPGTPCDPDLCQYARGYFDRRDDAVTAALRSADSFDRDAVERTAREFQVCPFELSLDLARWVDVVVCDYNYVFDPAVYLRRFFDEGNSRAYTFLVDEVHNLVDRGRDMFSASVAKTKVLEVRRACGANSYVGRALARLNRQFLALRKTFAADLGKHGHAVLQKLPEQLVAGLKDFIKVAEDQLRQGMSPDIEAQLLDVYFAALRFLRTAELYDACYVTLLTDDGKELLVKLYCLDPGPGLKRGFDRATATVLFSATLFPQAYFGRLLGVGGQAAWYELPSPFPAEHMGVFVVTTISTALQRREDGADALVTAIQNVVRARQGNYLVFFPSYAYMEMIVSRYVAAAGESVIVQRRDMDENERDAFVSRFGTGQPVTGFALMGGIFAEAVDLTGDQLVGVVVVGAGLPHVHVERDLIRSHFGDEGEHFAYQYPGMQRVLQTAGRLIRTENDRGVLCLVDHRFRQPFYQNMFPPHWQTRYLRHTDELGPAVERFWAGPN